MNIDQFLDRETQIFLALSEIKNISKTAEKLSLQQPHLSKILRRFETRLGQVLFYRSKSGLKHTPHGQQLHDSLRQALNQSRQAIPNEFHSSNLILGGHAEILKDFLAPKWNEISKEVGRLQLVVASSRMVTRQVINREVDVGLAVEPISYADLVLVPIRALGFRAWRKKGVKESEIQSYLMNPEMIGFSKTLKLLRSKQVVEIQDYDLACALTAQSENTACICPTHIAERNGNLISDGTDLGRVKLSMIYRRDNLAPQLKRVLDILRSLRGS